jgi:anti-anti-sigma factor
MYRDSVPVPRVDVAWAGGMATVVIHGELSLTTAPEVAARLAEVTSRQPSRLIVDLSGLPDSAGPRMVRIIDRARLALPPDCRLIIRSPTPAARRLIEVTGLSRVCVIEALTA